METPFVSIVIPVYNGARYLGEAIESALTQTYARREVIVVNDGSNDELATEGVARRFGRSIRYIRQDNKGVAGALNAAIAAMSGNVFTWLSHDDLFERTKTEIQVAYHRRANRDRIAFFSDFAWIDDKSRSFDAMVYDTRRLCTTPMLGVYECMINGCTTYIPKAVLDAVGPFDERFRHTQDYHLWWRIQRYCGFVHIPQRLSRVRRHSEQGSISRDALVETKAFWTQVVKETTPVETARIAGSRSRFIEQMGRFLRERTPNRALARSLLKEERLAATVSCLLLIDAAASIDAAIASLEGVGGQTRAAHEIVIAGTHVSKKVLSALRSHLKLPIRYEDPAPKASSLGEGLLRCRGDYIALLNAGDVWKPTKLEKQIAAMLQAGTLVSHTSYKQAGGASIVPAGSFTGHVYPEIIESSFIARSTIVIHRVIAAGGWWASASDCDWTVLVQLAQRHRFCGVEDVLADVGSQPIIPSPRALAALREDPIHTKHERQRGKALRRLDALAT